MSQRPRVCLTDITADHAQPLQEALQRTVVVPTKTADLEPLAFKVPPEFRKRFRQRALEANLKLNELLFAALSAWEIQNSKKS